MRTDIVTGLGRTTEIIYPLVGPELIVRYHDTDIIRVWHDKIVLNSAGWHDKSQVCRVKFNQAFNQFNIPLRLSRSGDTRIKVPTKVNGFIVLRNKTELTGTTAITRFDQDYNPIAIRTFTDGMEIYFVRENGKMRITGWYGNKTYSLVQLEKF